MYNGIMKLHQNSVPNNTWEWGGDFFFKAHLHFQDVMNLYCYKIFRNPENHCTFRFNLDSMLL